ncbi:uncharacterized protein [Haliotis cracherodii]|uniref:uncharacterized protein n=1 Tax=Haliotis cracherodii TaxID=6455 RepID=UPI0039EB4F2A
MEAMGIKINLNCLSGTRNFEAEGMPRLSTQQREQAIGRLQAGQRSQVVANTFNVHVSNIHRLQQRYNITNSTADRARRGRPRVTTPRQDRFIHRQHLRDRFRPASVTARNTIGTRGRPISDIRNIDQILRPYIVPYFAHHQNHVFQQDNARPHTARLTRNFLHQHNIQTMPLPAMSPDLKPIERLWDEIQRRLNQVVPTPRTRADLEAAFVRVWAQVPMAFVNRLLHSMYRGSSPANVYARRMMKRSQKDSVEQETADEDTVDNGMKSLFRERLWRRDASRYFSKCPNRAQGEVFMVVRSPKKPRSGKS